MTIYMNTGSIEDYIQAVEALEGDYWLDGVEIGVSLKSFESVNYLEADVYVDHKYIGTVEHVDDIQTAIEDYLESEYAKYGGK